MASQSFAAPTDKVRAEVVNEIVDLFQALPAKPEPLKAELTLRELVAQIYDAVIDLKAKRYSSSEICELLQEKFGVTMSPVTLENYIRKEKRERLKKPKPTRQGGLEQPSQRLNSPSVTPSPVSVHQSNDFDLRTEIEQIVDLSPVDAASKSGDSQIDPEAVGYTPDGAWVEPRFSRNRARPTRALQGGR